ncbi:MAG TPA: class I SAM-dependent methyltransferase [Acidimicrobiales bacterium]|nr:class I SAM-dependent methyltransferase [Acidimicrobiales bacterium]
MRANTDRSARFVFGDLVEFYDRGRPKAPATYVEAALHRLRSGSPRRQLEVGAGTGQLTAALVRLAPTVALEPSPPMAERLSDNLGPEVAAGRLQVWERTFESLDASDGPFDYIWSSDAWHWLEPAVAYPLAATLLTASGLLINTWGFPALADLGLTTALNEVYKELNPHLVREGAPRLSVEDELFADGRDEVERSGAMIVVDAWLDHRAVVVTSEHYLDWQLSFAHTAYLAVEQRLRLRDAIASVLAQRRTELVEVLISQYTVASAKTRMAGP